MSIVAAATATSSRPIVAKLTMDQPKQQGGLSSLLNPLAPPSPPPSALVHSPSSDNSDSVAGHLQAPSDSSRTRRYSAPDHPKPQQDNASSSNQDVISDNYTDQPSQATQPATTAAMTSSVKHTPMARIVAGHHKKSTSEDLTALQRMRELSDASDLQPSSPHKPKRKRITPEQLECLTSLFEQTDTPSFEIREKLSAKLNMTNREIQVWFQNRRAKVNRQRANEQNAQQQRYLQTAYGRGGPPSNSYTFVQGWGNRNQPPMEASGPERGHGRRLSFNEPRSGFSGQYSSSPSRHPPAIRPAPYSPRSSYRDSSTSPTISAYSSPRGHTKSQSLNISPSARSPGLSINRNALASYDQSFSPIKSPTQDFHKLSIHSPVQGSFPTHHVGSYDSTGSGPLSRSPGGFEQYNEAFHPPGYAYSSSPAFASGAGHLEPPFGIKQEHSAGIDTLMEAANTTDATSSLMALAHSASTGAGSTPHTSSSAAASPSPVLTTYHYENDAAAAHSGIDMLASAAEYVGKMETNQAPSSSNSNQPRWRPWD